MFYSVEIVRWVTASQMPRVSVVTPTYNHTEELDRAIQSVVDQTFDDLEHIVVDDASDECDPRTIVNRFDDDRLEYVSHEENKGAGAARNTGIAAAEGDLIAFLDSDDFWTEQKLERQVSEIESLNDEWVGVYCGVQTDRKRLFKHVAGRVLGDRPAVTGDTEVLRRLLYPNSGFALGSTFLVKRDAIERAGLFDESLSRYEEVELATRIVEVGKIGYVDEDLAVIGRSGYPRATAVARSGERLFETYRDAYSETDLDVEAAIRSHHFLIARSFFREGKFAAGYRYLKRAEPHDVRQYPRLGYCLFLGARELVRRESQSS